MTLTRAVQTSRWPIMALLGLTQLAACSHTPVDDSVNCEAFAGTRLGAMQISAASIRTDLPDLPDFCAVQGQIEPDIGFEARLPLTNWNGKYYQAGCGGYCGTVLPDKPGFSNTINEALKLGFAAITTDSGHSGGLGDASWAKNNPVAVAMYAGESIPITHAAGVELVSEFYGKSPRLEYFGGCSNGGRMAAKAAQQYPKLFDGILGGGAVLNLSQNGGLHGSWIVQSNARADGSRILDRQSFAARLPLLQQEILDQCDSIDGAADGIIATPRRCDVDVSLLPRCNIEPADKCFTIPELEVIERWYAGAQDSAGRQLYPGVPPGSEPFWAVWFLDDNGRVAPGNALGGDFTRYLGFDTPVDDDYTALDFDFDHDPPRLLANSEALDALNPNLREYRDQGGKFLMWHGWQDPLVLPDQSVDYLASVVQEFGDRQQVDAFMRLFMIPGQGHCWELPGTAPDRFNPIAVLDNWVENGTAPDKLVTRAFNPDTTDVDAAAVCPYPGIAQFFTTADEASVAECPATLVGD